MAGAICNTCKYYRRHYSFDQNKIFRIWCGHCVYGKTKTRKPDSKCCENYAEGESAEKGFVRKEFLSKALLSYMLSLDLLPEIQDHNDASNSTDTGLF